MRGAQIVQTKEYAPKTDELRKTLSALNMAFPHFRIGMAVDDLKRPMGMRLEHKTPRGYELPGHTDYTYTQIRVDPRFLAMVVDAGISETYPDHHEELLRAERRIVDILRSGGVIEAFPKDDAGRVDVKVGTIPPFETAEELRMKLELRGEIPGNPP